MEALKVIGVTLALIGVIVGICVGIVCMENKQFNNGVCPICETDFHLREIVGGKYTHYFYECENGHIIECLNAHYKGEAN